MNLITQVMNELKSKPKLVFLIGAANILGLYLISFIPLVSSYFIGFSVLLVGYVYHTNIHKCSEINKDAFRQTIPDITILATLLIPSVLMIGMGSNLILDVRRNASVISFSTLLFMAGFYFLTCCLMTLYFPKTKTTSLLKNLDHTFRITGKNITAFFWFHLGVALIMAVSGFTLFIPLVLLFPIIFSFASQFKE